MSIVRCEYCNKNIDTDFDAEHFEDKEMCVAEKDYKDYLDETLRYLFKNLNK